MHSEHRSQIFTRSFKNTMEQQNCKRIYMVRACMERYFVAHPKFLEGVEPEEGHIDILILVQHCADLAAS